MRTRSHASSPRPRVRARALVQIDAARTARSSAVSPSQTWTQAMVKVERAGSTEDDHLLEPSERRRHAHGARIAASAGGREAGVSRAYPRRRVATMRPSATAATKQGIRAHGELRPPGQEGEHEEDRDGREGRGCAARARDRASCCRRLLALACERGAARLRSPTSPQPAARRGFERGRRLPLPSSPR